MGSGSRRRSSRRLRAGGVDRDENALHVRIKGKSGTLIYRRTGAATWARLERSFLLRLPGEQNDIRKASPAELAAVQKLEKELGSGQPDWRPKEVAELTAYVLRQLRLGLGRHARRAGIAVGLAAHDQVLPGARVQAPLARSAPRAYWMHS